MPGEIIPEEVNQVGQELARKLTKDNHAFIVCTHIDKHHIHATKIKLQKVSGLAHWTALSRLAIFGVDGTD